MKTKAGCLTGSIKLIKCLVGLIKKMKDKTPVPNMGTERRDITTVPISMTM